MASFLTAGIRRQATTKVWHQPRRSHSQRTDQLELQTVIRTTYAYEHTHQIIVLFLRNNTIEHGANCSFLSKLRSHVKSSRHRRWL